MATIPGLVNRTVAEIAAHPGKSNGFETAALMRLTQHVLIEQPDEWDGADRRCFSEHSMKLLDTETKEVAIPELNAA